MAPRFDLVLFDLDGTLVQTAPEICDAVNDTLAHFSHPSAPQHLVEQWIGHGTVELLLQAWCRATSQEFSQARASQAFAAARTVFDGHYARRCGTRSRLYPHVREVLTRLREMGVKLALVTNKESAFTQRVLDMHRLGPLFDLQVCGDTLSTKKPDPQAIRHCMQRFNATPARCLFVGDSSIDVDCARAAAIAVWALPYGYNMGQSIAACGPDRVIDNLLALLPETTDGASDPL